MKKGLVLAMLVMFTSVVAFAQEAAKPDNKRPDPSKRYEQMAKELDLNEKQSKEFIKINKDFSDKAKKLRDVANTDKEKARTDMIRMRNDRNDQIKKVLTDDQFKNFQDKEKKQFGQRKGSGERSSGNRGGGQRGGGQRNGGGARR